jgi:hypothetical protein
MNRVRDSVVRYNISHNDQTHLVQIHGTIDEGNVIHNNLFYVDHSTVNIDYYLGGSPDNENRANIGATFKNNIFYANGQGRFSSTYSYGSSWERQYIALVDDSSKPFSNNLYFGPWLNGHPHDPRDFFGNPVYDGAPDIGVYEQSGQRKWGRGQHRNDGRSSAHGALPGRGPSAVRNDTSDILQRGIVGYSARRIGRDVPPSDAMG